MNIWDSPYVPYEAYKLKNNPRAQKQHEKNVQRVKAKIRRIQRNSAIREYARPVFEPKTILVKRKHAATSEAEMPRG